MDMHKQSMNIFLSKAGLELCKVTHDIEVYTETTAARLVQWMLPSHERPDTLLQKDWLMKQHECE